MLEQPTTATSGVPFPRKSRTVQRLDELLALSPADLSDLYRAAETPRLRDLDGDLRGRMLASPLAGRTLGRLVRAIGSWDRFPWRGKSFASHGEDHGEGANRVVTDRWKTARFETSIARSRAGDFDALQLDYDLPDNPFFIRRIKDEVRRVAPGVFLGQAWLEAGAKPLLCFYFGLESPPSAVESTP